LQDLDKLVIQALCAHADFWGEKDVAERKFLDAIAGFQETLSATDQRTMRASYMLADLYASQQRMDRAAEVLNRVTSAAIERWGAQHYKTLVPFLAVVDLLQSWNRPEHIQDLIHRALGNRGEDEGVRLLHIPLHQTKMVLGTQDDWVTARTKIFGESSDADTERRLAKLWMSANVGDVDEVLARLIAQCDKYPDTLTVQAVQTRCDLAGWHIYQGSRKEARSILKQAWSSLESYLGEQDLVPKELLGLCCRVAFLYFRARRCGMCDTVLEHVAHFAERHVLIPAPQCSIDLVVGLHINIGSEYHQRASWSRARPWYERALALLLCLRQPDHVLVQKLTKVLEEREYQLDSPGSPDGLASPYQVRFST
jgi:tetratricopeptide (TPR) repeat protein